MCVLVPCTAANAAAISFCTALVCGRCGSTFATTSSAMLWVLLARIRLPLPLSGNRENPSSALGPFAVALVDRCSPSAAGFLLDLFAFLAGLLAWRPWIRSVDGAQVPCGHLGTQVFVTSLALALLTTQTRAVAQAVAPSFNILVKLLADLRLGPRSSLRPRIDSAACQDRPLHCALAFQLRLRRSG